MTVREFMAGVDERIYRSPIVRAVANFGVVDDVEGAFFDKPRELVMPGGSVMTIALSFECQYREEFAALTAESLIEIDGVRYRYLYEVQPGGDESGKTIIQLGVTV